MREDGLQWAWHKRLISGIDVYSKRPIELIHTGIWNRVEPGPDFRNACIRIGTLTWHGDVEIHVKSSDWTKHKHQIDPAYNNVILHIVVENDQPLLLNGERVPTLVVDAHVISMLSYWTQKAVYQLPCRFEQYTFTHPFIHHFWRIRMARKHTEYSNEKEITAYILKQSPSLTLRKRNGRQRDLVALEMALTQLRNETNFHFNHGIVKELARIKEVLSKKLTAFESNSILINGVIPSLWKPQNEAELCAFTQTIPAEKNKIILQFQHILPAAKNAYETQALLEINRQLCSTNNCLTCEFGKKLLKT